MAASAVATVTAVINLLDKVLQCVMNMSNGDSANIEDVNLPDRHRRSRSYKSFDVRDIAYETHDAITEFLHHVPQHCHGYWFTKTCHVVAHFFKDFVPLRQFSSRMKAIKRKLNNILRNDHLLVGIEENKNALLSLVCSEESKDMVISVIGDVDQVKPLLFVKAIK
ncbi:hypothetical protein CFP56_026691 [Quercus suber]|uniref:Uncharacterized protein n=1 Tax=Quercus suber TaxID=58331 RepID=A0AAW0K193_QUESU